MDRYPVTMQVKGSQVRGRYEWFICISNYTIHQLLTYPGQEGPGDTERAAFQRRFQRTARIELGSYDMGDRRSIERMISLIFGTYAGGVIADLVV